MQRKAAAKQGSRDPGHIQPGMLHPIHYRIKGDGALGVFVAPCRTPRLPRRPVLSFVSITDVPGGVVVTAMKSSHPPPGVAVAPLGYKCIGCGQGRCRYLYPRSLEDPVNPTLIDWVDVMTGAVSLNQVPPVFVVTYAYDPPQVA